MKEAEQQAKARPQRLKPQGKCAVHGTAEAVLLSRTAAFQQAPGRARANHASARSVPLRCLCATVRRAGRLLTRRYEEGLRRAGVSSAQCELMMKMSAAGASSQGTLAKLLETDQTTLSRNLKLLLERRWIETLEDGRDGRRRTYRLASVGLAVLAEAEHCWRQAQEEMERRLGGPMAELWPVLDRILSAARKAA